MKKDVSKLEATMSQLQTQSKMMETQIAQMRQHIATSSRAPNQFPSQPDHGTKGSNHINVITTWSGKVVDTFHHPL